MSTWSRTPKSGSARWSPDRFFHFLSTGTGKVGSFVITISRTTASTFHLGPEIFPVNNDFYFIMVNDTTECNGNPCFTLPILVTWTFWWWGESRRCWTEYSVMNDVDEAQSSKALGLVIQPSDATTTTLHVTRSVLRLPLGSGCDTTISMWLLCDAASRIFTFMFRRTLWLEVTRP